MIYIYVYDNKIDHASKNDGRLEAKLNRASIQLPFFRMY
uniref:Uncharacterized protein n=1 Tax=Setaria viridis TaxID=4556 RepID=A0A4U6WCW1_SETVI|nr:hypothetical protein SEVIR_1G257266v2 [Setaria viridis]